MAQGMKQWRNWHQWDDILTSWLIWLAQSPRRMVLAGMLNVIVWGETYAVIEGVGPIEGPYWAIVTGTSTGYGDFSPASMSGRAVAMILMVSMIFIWTPLWGAYLAMRVIRDDSEFTHQEQEELKAEIAQIRQNTEQLLNLHQPVPPPDRNTN